MFLIMIPEPFASLLAAYAGGFQARSYGATLHLCCLAARYLL
jgi:hypothetical protein